MTRLQNFLNSKIIDVTPIPVRVKAGDLFAGDLFGIELECEGKAVNFDGVNNDILVDWEPHDDGSLRNNHGSSCEWVFKGPAPYKKAVERVGTLFDYFDKRKSKLVTSNRTSTHIHFNMGDKNAYQAVNVFILFTILEDLLDRYCGEDRRGNLFCLSSRHAEEQVRWMEACCFDKFGFNLGNHGRYCSLNMASLNKFGTVEFRGMRGLDNREDLLAWLSIVHEFCDYACYKMKNPVTLVEQISAIRPIGLLREIFSKENVNRLIKDVNEYDLDRSIYDGLRLVQMMCYKIGTEFDQVKLVGKDFWASFNEDKAVEVEAPVRRPFDPFGGLRNAPLMPRVVAGAGGRADQARNAERQAALMAEQRELQEARNRWNQIALDAAMPDRPAPAPRRRNNAPQWVLNANNELVPNVDGE